MVRFLTYTTFLISLSSCGIVDLDQSLQEAGAGAGSLSLSELWLANSGDGSVYLNAAGSCSSISFLEFSLNDGSKSHLSPMKDSPTDSYGSCSGDVLSAFLNLDFLFEGEQIVDFKVYQNLSADPSIDFSLNLQRKSNFSGFTNDIYAPEGAIIDDDGSVSISRTQYYSQSSNIDLGTDTQSAFAYDASSNFIYVGTYENGVHVVDTKGTANTADDTVVGVYNAASTPAVNIYYVADIEIDSTNNLLYIGGWGLYVSAGNYTANSGVYVIDTKGTATLTDDTLVGVYDESSSPGLEFGGVNDIYINHDLDIVYVSVGYEGGAGDNRVTAGVYAFSRGGTPLDMSDDSLLIKYNESSTPAARGARYNRVEYVPSTGLLYISATSGGGVAVIDTNKTATAADDTQLILYNGASSIPTSPHGAVKTHYSTSSGYLYILSSSSTASVSGLYVIDTKKTIATGDDVRIGFYSKDTAPSVDSPKWGAYLYVDEDNNKIYFMGSRLFIIDTKGTPEQADDTVERVDHLGNSSYIQKMTVIEELNTLVASFNRGVVFYKLGEVNSSTKIVSQPIPSEGLSGKSISWSGLWGENQSISMKWRYGDSSALVVNPLDGTDTSTLSDYGGYGKLFGTAVRSDGSLKLSDPPGGGAFYAVSWFDLGQGVDNFPAGAVVTVRMKLHSSTITGNTAYFFGDSHFGALGSTAALNEWVDVTFVASDPFGYLALWVSFDAGTFQAGDYLEIDNINIAMPESYWNAWEPECKEACKIAEDLSAYKWIQYQMNLSASDRSSSPILKSVVIEKPNN